MGVSVGCRFRNAGIGGKLVISRFHIQRGEIQLHKLCLLTPIFDGIHIENLKVTGAKVALDIEGLPEAPIKNLVLNNVQIGATKAGKIYYADMQSHGLKVVPQDGQPLTVGTGVTGSLK